MSFNSSLFNLNPSRIRNDMENFDWLEDGDKEFLIN
jgi:hypothetical protein